MGVGKVTALIIFMRVDILHGGSPLNTDLKIDLLLKFTKMVTYQSTLKKTRVLKE